MDRTGVSEENQDHVSQMKAVGVCVWRYKGRRYRSRRGKVKIENVMEIRDHWGNLVLEKAGVNKGKGRGLLIGWHYLWRTQVCAVRSQEFVSICGDFLLQYSLPSKRKQGWPRVENECGYGSQGVPGIGPIMDSRHNLWKGYKRSFKIPLKPSEDLYSLSD